VSAAKKELDKILAGGKDDVSLQASEVTYWVRNPKIPSIGFYFSGIQNRHTRQMITKKVFEWNEGKREAASFERSRGLIRLLSTLLILKAIIRKR
jgi:hypothetical protein